MKSFTNKDKDKDKNKINFVSFNTKGPFELNLFLLKLKTEIENTVVK